MLRLTPEQLAELVERIKLAADVFTLSMLGKDHLDPDVLRRLKEAGLLPEEATLALIEYGFVLGRLRAFLNDRRYTALSFQELLVQADVHRPHTWLEEAMLDAIERAVGHDVRSLERKVVDATLGAVQGGELAGAYEALGSETPQAAIQAVVRQGIADRKSIGSVISDLRSRLKSYESDWTRIAASEMQTAVNAGIATAIREERGTFEGQGGPEARVYVKPLASACTDCKELYLDGGVPKTFVLSALLANGTNRGRSRAKGRDEWLPVVPPAHPHCACMMRILPPGYGLDASGKHVLADPDALDAALRKRRRA